MSDETKNDLPVESGNTVDEALDIFNDSVSDLAIPEPVKKNLLKAVDRLLCALIDIPVQKLQEGPAEKRAILEERTKFMRAVNAQNMRHIEADPEFAARASRTFTHRVLRERLNLEKVFSFVIDIFRKKKYDNSENQPTGSETETPINEDWFNIFEKEASQKSSEEMQRRFAQVLAGEIEKPGSHSIKAVKALGDMDQETAELFQRLCSMSVVFENLVDKSIHDLRVPSLGGTPGQNHLLKYGLSFAQILMLIEYDLVAPNFETRYGYKSCILDKEKNVADPFRHQGRCWILKPSPERPESNEFKLGGVQLSYVGFQLFHIIDQILTPQYTNDLKEYFAKQQLEMVEVSIEKRGQNIRWRII